MLSSFAVRAMRGACVMALLSACAPAPVADLGPVPSASPGSRCLSAAERAGIVRFVSDNGASLAGVVLGAGRQVGVVRFTSDNGASLAGVVLGNGPVGVVMAHSNNTDLCDWVPYGRVLAGSGYTALSIDLNGYGASQASAGVPVDPRYDQDLSAAVRLLRGRGAGTVFLLGEVIGGTAAVKAAAVIVPPVAGVVAVSSVADTLRMDAVAAARVLKVPLLCIASDIDEFLDDTRRIASAAPDAELLVATGSTSGETNLFDPSVEPKAVEVRAAVSAFLHRHAR